MCNLSFLTDDLSITFFQNQRLLQIILDLVLNSSSEQSLEEALKTVVNLCIQDDEYSRNIAIRCTITDWRTLFFKIPLSQISKLILGLLRFYVKLSSDRNKPLELPRCELESLLQVVFHSLRGFQKDQQVWASGILTLTEAVQPYPNISELIEQGELLEVLTQGYLKWKTSAMLGQLAKLFAVLVLHPPIKTHLVLQNIIASMLAYILKSHTSATSDSIASHFFFFANFLSSPHEANVELLNNSVYLKLIRTLLEQSQHYNIAYEVIYNVKLILASLELPRVQTIKLIQSLMVRITSQTADLTIIEQGLDCFALFIQKGEDQKRSKRMRDLIELDLLQALEIIEKRGGIQQEILVQSFYEKFIEQSQAEVASGIQEKISL